MAATIVQLIMSVGNLRNVTTKIALDPPRLIPRQKNTVGAQFHRDAKPFENPPQHPVMTRRGAVHCQLAAGGGRQREKTSRFDVVPDHGVIRAVKLFHAFDLNGVAAGAGDLRAHRIEQKREIAHMRFAGGVVECGDTGSGGCGNQDLFRCGDAGFIQKELATAEPAGGPEPVGPLAGHACPELAESVKVTVETAAADHVAAGRVKFGASAAGKKRGGEKDAGPVAGAERL